MRDTTYGPDIKFFKSDLIRKAAESEGLEIVEIVVNPMTVNPEVDAVKKYEDNE